MGGTDTLSVVKSLSMSSLLDGTRHTAFSISRKMRRTRAESNTPPSTSSVTRLTRAVTIMRFTRIPGPLDMLSMVRMTRLHKSRRFSTSDYCGLYSGAAESALVREYQTRSCCFGGSENKRITKHSRFFSA